MAVIKVLFPPNLKVLLVGEEAVVGVGTVAQLLEALADKYGGFRAEVF